MGNLGAVLLRSGDVRGAIDYCEKALTIAREVCDRRVEANQWGTLGLAYATLGDLEKAIRSMERVLAIGRDIKDAGIVSLATEQLEEFSNLQ